MTCGCKDHGNETDEINTSTCITQRPCTQPIAGGNCVSCGCSPCQCGQSTVATPLPYYAQAPGVQECHKQVVIQQSFVTAITTSTSFNMPACQSTAIITIPGLNQIQVGGYLWNAVYGYLKVVSFDYVNSQITVKNECQTGNASPGTPIPACIKFNVVDPPLTGTGGLSGVFLAVDFVAPDVGNCIDIQVTGVAGLTIGQNIQIGSGVYNLSAIVSPTIITICNTGQGVTHGVVVPAKDGSGQYITPITPLSSNACDNTVQTTGTLLSCHNGIQAPLAGQAVGQVPVLIDAANSEVQFQSLDLPTSVCSTMTACLNLLNGVSVYVINVADNTIFTLGDIVIIHDPQIETFRWEITNIDPDTIHITISLVTPAPPNTLVATVGCNDLPICLAPCCEQLAAGTQICNYDWSAAFLTKPISVGTDNVSTTMSMGDTKNNGGCTITITNPTCNNLDIILNLDYVATGTIMTTEGSWSRFAFNPYLGYVDEAIGGGGVVSLSLIYSLYDDEYHGIGTGEDPCEQYLLAFSKTYHHSFSHTIAPGNQLKISTSIEIAYDFYVPDASGCCPCDNPPTPATGLMTLSHFISTIQGLGVAVQAAP